MFPDKLLSIEDIKKCVVKINFFFVKFSLIPPSNNV